MSRLNVSINRADVARALRALGWERTHGGFKALMADRAVWAPTGSGDSSVSRYRARGADEFTIGFAGDVPVEVIVATCEASR